MLRIIPYQQDDDAKCGPASIKMILDYWRIPNTIEEICEKCGWTYELGCTDVQMKRALEFYGMKVVIKNDSTFSDIEDWLDRRIPVIVDWFTPGINPSIADMPNGHSSVVSGLTGQHIYLVDPELGATREILKKEFLRVWFDWKNKQAIRDWNDMVLRQIIAAYPKKQKLS